LEKKIKSQPTLPGQPVTVEQLSQIFEARTQKLVNRYNSTLEILQDFGEFLQGYLQLQNTYIQSLKDEITKQEQKTEDNTTTTK
jgi:hypothetical protein